MCVVWQTPSLRSSTKFMFMMAYLRSPPPPPPPPPSHTLTDWTLALTSYMNVCVTRLCNESPLLKSGGKHDTHTSRHQSTGGNHAHQGPSEEDEAELNKWQYVTHLASHLYQENLLDRHEFLKWLVEEEFIKASDNKVLQLYLPLVLTVSWVDAMYLVSTIVYCSFTFQSSNPRLEREGGGGRRERECVCVCVCSR